MVNTVLEWTEILQMCFCSLCYKEKAINMFSETYRINQLNWRGFSSLFWISVPMLKETFLLQYLHLEMSLKSVCKFPIHVQDNYSTNLLNKFSSPTTTLLLRRAQKQITLLDLLFFCIEKVEKPARVSVSFTKSDWLVFRSVEKGLRFGFCGLLTGLVDIFYHDESNKNNF